MDSFHEEMPSDLSFAFALVNFQMTEMVSLKMLSILVLFMGEIISLTFHFTIARSLSSGLVSQ